MPTSRASRKGSKRALARQAAAARLGITEDPPVEQLGITEDPPVKQDLTMIYKILCNECSDKCAVNWQCSGTRPPAHLLPEKDFVYPSEVMRDCSSECMHFMCMVPDGSRVDTISPVEHNKWFLNLCKHFDLNNTSLFNALSKGHIPPYVVFQEHPSRNGFNVVAYMTSTRLKTYIFPVLITNVWTQGCHVRHLRCFRETQTRKQFAALSEKIEDLADSLSEQEYKTLYESAQALFNVV